MTTMVSGEMQERIDAMRERAATKPRSFQFSDEQHEFVGNFLRWESSPPHPTYGESLLAIFAEYPSGEEITLWLYHRVLRNALLRQNPQPGELVLIDRGEKVTPEGGGNSYFNYAVVISRDEGGGLTLEQAKSVARRQAGGIDDVDVVAETEAHEAALAGYEPDAPADEDIPF